MHVVYLIIVHEQDPKPATLALVDAAGGDLKAAHDMLPLVYDELRSLARARLNKIPPGQTLQATALVHDAYLRIVKGNSRWSSRSCFVAAAACAMRDILVEQARRKSAIKRGGGRRRVQGEQVELAVDPPPDEVQAIDEAIHRLEQADPRKGQIVNLRYFARMTASETAAVLGVSVATVGREWRYIRAWLARELAGGDPD